MLGLLVAISPPLVEGLNVLLGPARDQRPSRQLLNAEPDGLERNVDVYGRRAVGDQSPVIVVHHGAATKRDDRSRLQSSRQHLLFQGAERGFAAGRKEIRDGHSGLVLDQMVE